MIHCPTLSRCKILYHMKVSQSYGSALIILKYLIYGLSINSQLTIAQNFKIKLDSQGNTDYSAQPTYPFFE
jgi:hypothetical protein